MTLRKISSALIDLSGTLHIDDVAIPGAVEALDRLRKSGIKIRFVSNTTKESSHSLHSRLTTLGFSIDRSEIFTSLTAARRYVEEKRLRPLLLLEEDSKEDFKGISEENPNCVVVGLAPSKFNYEYMNKSFQLLKNGAQLVAIHKGRYYQRKDGLALGPGPFVVGLEMGADVKATVIGKPEPAFFKEALTALQCSAGQAVMIGDDVRDDVAGAMNAGLNAILVRTGKYRDGDESKISPAPAHVCESFPAAVDLIVKQINT